MKTKAKIIGKTDLEKYYGTQGRHRIADFTVLADGLIVKPKRENEKMKYYILNAWLGRDNSWEPEENIQHELIQEYHTRKHNKTHKNNVS